MSGSDGQIKIDTKIEQNNVNAELRQLQREISNMSKELQLANTKALLPFHKQMFEVEKKFHELGTSMGSFTGTNKDFMNQVQQLGAEQKKVADDMLKANTMARMSLIQTAGTMMNMSSQASKISSNYQRMANPIYNVNRAGLAVADSLDRIARNGNASVLALRLLGPNANMKQLQDMIGMINQGLMRFQAVALVAAAASAILYTSLFKAAKGPDPSEVYAKQAEALAAYAQAVDQRTQEIMNTWSLFDEVQLNSTNPNKLIQNLADQVTTLQGWRMNLGTIAQRAGTDFANYLSKMGPASAAEVRTISEMTDSELAKYVDLWRQKMIHARMEAMTELEKLKAETDKKVKDLQATLTPLGLALEPLKATWAEAFKPMVELFGQIMTPIVQFLTKIGEMVVAFNQAHPVLAKIIQGFLMFIPLLTLILSPLAIGIGLWAGLQAAWTSVWAMIGPLITGLAAISATVWIVAAAIVALVAVFIYLWNTNEGFKNAIIAGWQAIQAAAVAIWSFILNGVLIPIWTALVALGQQLFGQLKDFWQQNGDEIMQIAQVIWSFVSQYIVSEIQRIVQIATALFKVFSSVVQSSWGTIKNIISAALGIILGIIGVFVNLATGNWRGAWENYKNIVQNAWSLIANASRLGVDILLGVIRGIGNAPGGVFASIGQSFYNAGKGFMDMMVKGVQSAVGSVLSTIESVAGQIRDFLPFSPAKVGPLSDLDKLDFGGPIADSIKLATPLVQHKMESMLSMPSLSALSNSVTRTIDNSRGDINVNLYPKEATIDENKLLRSFERTVLLYG